MRAVLFGIWPLLLGILFIMLGNGMHFTLIGLRGDIEGFTTGQLAFVTSSYFIGFLLGARISPRMIRRVGHVRVFAALGSFMSAGLITFPLIAEPWAWTLLRLLVGFCMSGIYVTAESWLNEASTNESRGKVLSAYMICQTLGVIGAQGLLSLGDAATATLFIGASILVSISFAPILLTMVRAPAVEVAPPMSMRELFASSPLSTVGIFLAGSIYASQAGMAVVFGSQIELSAPQIALLVATFFAGALALQFPIGILSDRIGRRKLILTSSVLGGLACVAGALAGEHYGLLLAAAFFSGGVTSPLYALFLAYTNDYLPHEAMPAASGGLVFTFGLGAIVGPLVTGWAMQLFSPSAYWWALAGTFLAIVLYAMYRSTQRPDVPVDEAEPYLSTVVPAASPVAVEAAGVWASEQADEEEGNEESP